MKPLREQDDPKDLQVARAVRLLERVGPVPHSRLTQRRVRYRIESASRNRAALVLRPAVALGLLCGLAATAGAAWGVVHFTTSSAPRHSPPRLVLQKVPAKPKAIETKRTPLPPVQEDAPGADQDEPQSDPPAPVVRVQGQPAAVKRSKPAQTRAASDAALVHGAVRELRNGGDPERASRLLEKYRAQNPSGVLAEEALALSIEAAAAKGDPDRKRLARQYLAKYPDGRFVAAARRALR